MEAPANDNEELFSLLYGELRQLAHSRLLKSGRVTLLDTTSLVNETFLRVARARRLEISDRSQFLAYAGRVMRSVVVDFVRQRVAERRGGDQERVTLDTESAGHLPSPEERNHQGQRRAGRTGEGGPAAGQRGRDAVLRGSLG